jgi:hypothetical protein
MLSKSNVIEVINSMSDQFSLDELFEKLIVLNKIQIGLELAKKGEDYPTDVAKQMVKK